MSWSQYATAFSSDLHPLGLQLLAPAHPPHTHTHRDHAWACAHVYVRAGKGIQSLMDQHWTGQEAIGLGREANGPTRRELREVTRVLSAVARRHPFRFDCNNYADTQLHSCPFHPQLLSLGWVPACALS